MVSIGKVISTAIQFIDGFTRPSAQAIESMKRMGREIQNTGRQIQNVGKAISSVGSTMTKAVTIPIAGVATAAIKTAADFEASMSKVGAISGEVADNELSGITKKAAEMGLSFKQGANTTETAMNILKAKAQQMGATTSFSASESADAMQYMAMAGWKATDMMDGIAGIMNLAAASGEDLAKTSDIVTDGLTAFGMTAKDSSRFADVMAATASNANTNVALMGETFKYCASTAGAMGYSIEDVSVAIGIMGNAGIKGSMAGTTIKNTIANLAKPTAKQAEVMKKLGISLTDSGGNMKSFAQVMDNLRSSFSGLSKTEKAAAATTLAGKQSMEGFLTIVNAGAEDFDKLTAAIDGSSGSAAEMAAKMLDNLNGQLTLLKSAAEGILITIGNKLTPYAKTVVEWVQKAADYINNLSDAQLDNIIKWAGIAAAIGPAIMMFGKMVTTVGKIIRTFGTVIRTIGTFKGILGVITSPAGIVIGVLAAIAFAAFMIIKNWDQVKDFLQNVGKWFQNAFEKAGLSVQGFTGKFQSIGNIVRNIARKIGDFCKSIAGFFKDEFLSSVNGGAAEMGDILEMLVGGIATTFDSIVTAADKGLQALDALLGFFAGAFAGDWSNAAQGFRDSLKDIFPPDMAKGLTNAFDAAFPVIQACVSGVIEVFKGLGKDIRKVFQAVGSIFEGIGTMFKGIFSGDAETALKGFQTVAGGIIDAIGNIFKTKINALKNFVVGAFSTFLPEKQVKKISGAFDLVAGAWDIAIGAAKGCVSGFVQAIKPFIENIKTIFKGVGQFIKGVFSGDWKGALNGLKSIADGILSGMVNTIKAPFKLVANAVKGVVSSFKKMNIVKGIFSGLGNAVKNVLSKCGVNMDKFSGNINNIKTRISNIINGLKTIFGTVFQAIGGVVRSVATVIANIFGKKVDDSCSTAGAVITAFQAVAGTAFHFIAEAIKKAMNIIVPVVTAAFGAVKGVISAAVDTITSIISGVLTVFDGVITFITGVFSGNWKQAWEGVKTIFKGVFDTFSSICKAPINAVIGIINGAISGLNKVKIDIPDWVPVLGGKTYGIHIPTIPMLYQGTSNWRGGTAIIHDRGGEIVDLPKGTRVYPHDKSIALAWKEGAKAALTQINSYLPGRERRLLVNHEPSIPMLYQGTSNWRGGTAIIHDRGGEIVDLPKGTRVYPHDKSIALARKEGERNNSGSISIQIQKLADNIVVRSDEDIDRIVEALVFKLKKVALNTGIA